jgi:hypothetical protein
VVPVRITVSTRDSSAGQLLDITAWQYPSGVHVGQYLLGLTEHDLRDLESVLAQRRAMSRRCTAEHGEHTCSLAPGHIPDAGHICRACTETWPVTEA